jgi:hypothetical protein
MACPCGLIASPGDFEWIAFLIREILLLVWPDMGIFHWLYSGPTRTILAKNIDSPVEKAVIPSPPGSMLVTRPPEPTRCPNIDPGGRGEHKKLNTMTESIYFGRDCLSRSLVEPMKDACVGPYRQQGLLNRKGDLL